MVVGKNDSISAQVILHSESGKKLSGKTLVTSENISDFLPSPETVNTAQNIFRDMGFEVGNAVGVGFSITAPVSIFENTLTSRIRKTKDKGFEFLHFDGTSSNELPKSSLAIFPAGTVQAILFIAPPDFGPTDFSMQ